MPSPIQAQPDHAGHTRPPPPYRTTAGKATPRHSEARLAGLTRPRSDEADQALARQASIYLPPPCRPRPAAHANACHARPCVTVAHRPNRTNLPHQTAPQLTQPASPCASPPCLSTACHDTPALPSPDRPGLCFTGRRLATDMTDPALAAGPCLPRRASTYRYPRRRTSAARPRPA